MGTSLDLYIQQVTQLRRDLAQMKYPGEGQFFFKLGEKLKNRKKRRKKKKKKGKEKEKERTARVARRPGLPTCLITCQS